MTTDDDDRLLWRCQRGDEPALRELVCRYQDRLFRMALRVLGDALLAEEATAAVLVKLWSRSGQWRGEASAGTWIYRVAVHTILDTRRRQRRWWQRWFGLASDDTPDPRPEPSEQVARKDEHAAWRRDLQTALAQLSESDRLLVHLYYFEDRGLAEIEAILDVPRANLKMRLARARDRLRGLLEHLRESF